MTLLRLDLLLLVAFFGLASRVSLQDRLEFTGLFMLGLATAAIVVAHLGLRVFQQRARVGTWLLVLAIALMIALSSRSAETFKNALVFWPVLLPLLVRRCTWGMRLGPALDLLWAITLGLVLIDILSITAQAGLSEALFGDSFRLVFSERTWVGLFFALYTLHYVTHARNERNLRTKLLLKAAVSVTIALITQSFAVVLSLLVLAPLVLTRGLVGRAAIVAAIVVAVPLAAVALTELIDLKVQARAIALFDEIDTPRSPAEWLLGGIEARGSHNYEDLPGVPEIGLNSFSLPFFLLNNFGTVGMGCFFLLLALAARRVRYVPTVLLATTVVSCLHPVHLQLEFMLLATLLTLTLYPPSDTARNL